MKQTIILLLLVFTYTCNLYSQKIEGGEYFIGNDPGIGNGVSFSLDPSDSVKYISNVLIQNLNVGFHIISIRIVDENGLWSQVASYPFYLPGNIEFQNPTIVKGELFYGTDPGIGNGIGLELNKADSISKKFQKGIGNLGTGNRIAGVRLMDSLGRWSHTYSENFNVCLIDGTISNFSYINTGHTYTFFDSSYNASTIEWVYSFRNEFKSLFSNGRNPSKTFNPGTYYIEQITTNICDEASNGIYIIVPGVKRSKTTAPKMDNQTVEIRGGGFADSTEFYLKFSSADTNFVLYPERKFIENSIMTGVFDFGNAYLGNYDLFVEKLSDTILKSDSVERYLTIFEPDIGGIYKAILSYPPFIRTGRSREFNSILGVSGNVNLSTEPLFLEFDVMMQDVKVKLDEVLPNNPVIGNDFDEFDEDFFKPQRGVYVENVHNEEKKQFVLYPYIFNSAVQSGFEINVRSDAVSKQVICMSYFKSDLGKKKNMDSIGKCLTFVTLEVLDHLTGGQADDLGKCMDEVLSKLLEEALPVLYKDVLQSDSQSKSQPDTNLQRQQAVPVTNLATGVKSALEKCAKALFIAGVSSELAMINALKKLYDILTKIEKGVERVEGLVQCANAFGIIDRNCFELNFASSIDPNDKTGVSNIPDKNYVKSDDFLPYLIRFENLDSATLAAQEVIILDTLDKSKLDFSTFYFSKVTFGDFIYNLVEEPGRFSVDIDRRPEHDYIVRITGDLDTLTGEVRVVYITMDPNKMELTQNDTLGFLPPNKISPEGEGSVSYFIKPKANVASGSNISNKANIFFDVNPPILTNQWFVTIDDIKPMSVVNQIDSVVYSDSVMIVFNGFDSIGEIAGFNLFVSESNQEFKLHSINKGVDTIYFKGAYDSSYKFYALAFDYAGNIEEAKSSYDTYTTIRKLNPPNLIFPADSSLLVSTFPNFQWSSANFALKYQIQIADTIDFSNLILDNSNLTGTNYIQNDALEYSKQYFWRMRTINGTYSSDWSDEYSFITIKEPDYVPADWAFTSNTGKSAKIKIPIAINPKVGQRNLAFGDGVGVFFSRNDSLISGGYGLWGNDDLMFDVWGDNIETQFKDGFSSNEKFRFKVWDAQSGKVYEPYIEYLSGPDNFVENALSILSLFKTTFSQHISLNSGWNLISSNIEPENSSIPIVWNEVKDNVVIVKNNVGATYIPAFEIDDIKNWKSSEGYQVYVTQADTLVVTGMEIEPTNSPITLNVGWNIISYLRNSELDCETAFANIINNGNLIIVKDNEGNVYIPAYEINSIGNLIPGQGYQIYVLTSDELIYPGN